MHCLNPLLNGKLLLLSMVLWIKLKLTLYAPWQQYFLMRSIAMVSLRSRTLAFVVYISH